MWFVLLLLRWSPHQYTVAHPPLPVAPQEDIEGAQADWKPAWQRRALASPPRNPLAVDDITHVGFKTKRVTCVQRAERGVLSSAQRAGRGVLSSAPDAVWGRDPLRPRHTVHGMTVEDGEDTYPRHTRTPRKEDRRFTTADIEVGGPSLPRCAREPLPAHRPPPLQGAQTGWRPHYNLGGLTDSKRRTFRNPVATQDVPGAQANTVRRCIRTNRHINPNAPDYTALDGTRPGPRSLRIRETALTSHPPPLFQASAWPRTLGPARPSSGRPSRGRRRTSARRGTWRSFAVNWSE